LGKNDWQMIVRRVAAGMIMVVLFAVLAFYARLETAADAVAFMTATTMLSILVAGVFFLPMQFAKLSEAIRWKWREHGIKREVAARIGAAHERQQRATRASTIPYEWNNMTKTLSDTIHPNTPKNN